MRCLLKMRKKTEKNANKCKKMAQDPSKRTVVKTVDGIREASSEGGEAPPKGGLRGRLVKYRSTRWGVGDPRALGRSAGLRETARGS